MNLKNSIFLVSFFCFALIHADKSFAQSITTIQDINFGEAVVRNNDAQYSIEINANGSFSIDPFFGTVSNPIRGEYLATGLPAGVPIISVTVTVDQQLIGAGEDFTIDNFDIDAPANADGSGELPILLGARLQTSGVGTNYLDTTSFASVMTLTVNY